MPNFKAYFKVKNLKYAPFLRVWKKKNNYNSTIFWAKIKKGQIFYEINYK